MLRNISREYGQKGGKNRERVVGEESRQKEGCIVLVNPAAIRHYGIFYNFQDLRYLPEPPY